MKIINVITEQLLIKMAYTLLLLLMTFFLVMFFIAPKSFFVLTYYGKFNFIAIFHLVAFLLCSFMRSENHRVFHNLMLSFILFSFYLSFPVKSLGDHDLLEKLMRQNYLWKSELLAILVYHIFFKLSLNSGYIAPLYGFFTSFAYLNLCDYLFRNSKITDNNINNRLNSDVVNKDIIQTNNKLKYKKTLINLYFIGSGIHLIFFRDYVENTLTGLPFLILFIYFLARYYSNPALKDLIFLSLFYAIGILFHAQVIFLFPAIPIVISLKNIYDIKNKPIHRFLHLLLHFLMSMGVIVALITIVYVILVKFGFIITSGNIYGGGDNTMFVPLKPVRSPYFLFTMFSISHFNFLSNILSVSFPMFFIFPIFQIIFYFQKKEKRFELFTQYPFLGILSLGYIFFIILWNFDLGFPVDYDLMISMSIPLQLLLINFLINLEEKYFIVHYFILPINIIYSWIIIFSLLK